MLTRPETRPPGPDLNKNIENLAVAFIEGNDQNELICVTYDEKDEYALKRAII